ncbi:MAG: DUF433 domain-containing protein [Anaerolineae bacterium]|nr:DUF433 domain-containing protein [Anaerolineae bacterium]
MLIPPIAMNVPLHTDDNGVIRVSNTRVTLYTLISFFKQGDTPEALHDGFPTVPLADIYAIIAYYLAHRTAVDAYLQQIDVAAERTRQEWEARQSPPTKAELQARLNRNKGDD